MKASLVFGKGKASHNDRSFDVSKSDHIDQERQNLNRYMIFSLDKNDRVLTNEQWELKYYSEHYSEALEETNKKYMEQRHPEKCREMKDWIKTYKPTEAIIQIGNKEEQVD